MSYMDKYPGCIGCPVEKYCGTMVSSSRLCHSYDDSVIQKESHHVLTLSEAATAEEEKVEERLTMWDSIME